MQHLFFVQDMILCDLCPYKSKHGCDMKAHIKMHSHLAPFRCDLCSYSSFRYNALKDHEELHMNDDPNRKAKWDEILDVLEVRSLFFVAFISTFLMFRTTKNAFVWFAQRTNEFWGRKFDAIPKCFIGVFIAWTRLNSSRIWSTTRVIISSKHRRTFPAKFVDSKRIWKQKWTRMCKCITQLCLITRPNCLATRQFEQKRCHSNVRIVLFDAIGWCF